MTDLQITSMAIACFGLILLFGYVRHGTRMYRKIGFLTLAVSATVLLLDQGIIQAAMPRISLIRGCEVTVYEDGQTHVEDRCKR